LTFLVDLGMETRNKLKDTQLYFTRNPSSDTTFAFQNHNLDVI
jgi:hypothetical protein